MVDNEIEDLWCVYKIVHTSTGMTYYGCTCNPTERLKQHYAAKGAPKLHEALRLYGLEGFSMAVVSEHKSRRKDHASERDFIREHNTIWPNGFNLQKGGEGSLVANMAPDARAANAKRMKQVFAQPGAREARRKQALEFWSGEVGKKRRAEQKERWNDPEFRERALAGIRQMTQWNGPDREVNRERASRRMSALNKVRWQDPKYAARMVEIMVARDISPATDEARAKVSASLRRFYDSPESTDSRHRRSEANKKRWEDPAKRAAQSVALKAAWARKRTSS